MTRRHQNPPTVPEAWFECLDGPEREARYAEAMHARAAAWLPPEHVYLPGARVIVTDHHRPGYTYPATIAHFTGYPECPAYGVTEWRLGTTYCGVEQLRPATAAERASLWEDGHPVKPGEVLALW